MTSQTSMRYIKANHSKSIPRYVMAVDTETKKTATNGKRNENSHTFRLACSMFGRVTRGGISGIEQSTHIDVSGFWARLHAVTSSRHTVWVVATKALFDLKVLGIQDELEFGNLTLDSPRSKRNPAPGESPVERKKVLCVIDGVPFIVCCRSSLTGGRIIFVDTLNWIKLPVHDLGLACGESKLAMPMDSGTHGEWEEYCKRDTLITFLTFAGLMGWCVKNDMGQFVYSAAGQAMHAYRHRFMDCKIAVHDNQEVKAIERLAYFGGRTTVFRRGVIKDDVFQFDVNSLFPSVMARYAFPAKMYHHEIRSGFGPIPSWNDPDRCAAMVRVHTDKPLYPVRINRRVFYPVGTFNTALCGAELGRAVRQGCILGVGSYAEYECRNLFARWVKELYEMRLAYKAEGNKLYDLFTKSLLNSLYGKFGQLSPEWIYSPDDQSGVPWTHWRGNHPITGEQTEFRSVAYDVFYKDGKRELPSTFVAIAGFVTSAARCYMDGLREVAGIRNVVYQGCDSIIVTREGKDRLEGYGTVDPTKLGSLKLDCQGNFGEIYGQQDYQLGDKCVIAGRSNYYSDTGNGTYSQHRFLSAADLFRPGHREEIIEQIVSWQRTQQYDASRNMAQGWIAPLAING